MKILNQGQGGIDLTVNVLGEFPTDYSDESRVRYVV